MLGTSFFIILLKFSVNLHVQIMKVYEIFNPFEEMALTWHHFALSPPRGHQVCFRVRFRASILLVGVERQEDGFEAEKGFAERDTGEVEADDGGDEAETTS